MKLNPNTIEAEIRGGKISNEMTFSQQVWAMTARIPAGQVATYADLARRLRTKGYRAVGGALNRNPYAPAVPCHRVVGSDGSLTGFAGGLPKKKQMLSDEGISFVGSKVDLRRHRIRAI
ncbi:MAG: MGMT family protein [Planctomycetota bacterium]|nr:MGMT family protein [Planctomycetota bacterium]